MLVTNMGQVIRIRVHGGEGDSIRVASRKTHGVRLFDVADDDNEKVVSAGLVRETDDGDDEASTEVEPPEGAGDNAAPTFPEMAKKSIKNETPSLADPNEETPA